MSKATETDLDALHGALQRALFGRIANGSATASDLAVAAKFLKDNGISRLLDRGIIPGQFVPPVSDEVDEYDDIATRFQ